MTEVTEFRAETEVNGKKVYAQVRADRRILDTHPGAFNEIVFPELRRKLAEAILNELTVTLTVQT